MVLMKRKFQLANRCSQYEWFYEDGKRQRERIANNDFGDVLEQKFVQKLHNLTLPSVLMSCSIAVRIYALNTYQLRKAHIWALFFVIPCEKHSGQNVTSHRG